MNGQHCPEPSIIAAYVDGKLNAYDRRVFERHLADCAECPMVVGGTVRFLKELNGPQDAARPSLSRWRWIAVAAAVAGVALALLAPRPTPLDDVRTIAAHASERPIEGRLKAFPHRRFTSTRSAAPRTADLALQAVIERLENGGNHEAMHARGVALLLNGRHDEAVRVLSRLTATAGTEAAWNDLAAAHLASASTGGASTPAEALQATNHALARAASSPEAHFNRAVALEHLGRTGEALQTYRRAFKLEPAAAWRNEIAERIAHLEGR